MKTFASDNNAPVHPLIMKAISEVNIGDTISYGDDVYTESSTKKFKEILGENIQVFYVYNGTAANVLSMSSFLNSFNAIICSDVSHINNDECGAPEKLTGCKLISIPSDNGKIKIDSIKKYLHSFGFEHHSQPKIVSITQSTEFGTVYLPEEIKAIADFCHKNNMLLHVDGARIANAVVSLNCDIKDITLNAGVDILSFGGTKNGMMFGEAVVFFNKDFGSNFKYIRKQGMQLASKMRYISAQFEALLTDNLWLRNAENSNNMAVYLANQLREIPSIKITKPVQANAIFAIIPMNIIPKIQEKYFFYEWDEEISEVRFMTSFCTTKAEVDDFVKTIKELTF